MPLVWIGLVPLAVRLTHRVRVISSPLQDTRVSLFPMGLMVLVVVTLATQPLSVVLFVAPTLSAMNQPCHISPYTGIAVEYGIGTLPNG